MISVFAGSLANHDRAHSLIIKQQEFSHQEEEVLVRLVVMVMVVVLKQVMVEMVY